MSLIDVFLVVVALIAMYWLGYVRGRLDEKTTNLTREVRRWRNVHRMIRGYRQS